MNLNVRHPFLLLLFNLSYRLIKNHTHAHAHELLFVNQFPWFFIPLVFARRLHLFKPYRIIKLNSIQVSLICISSARPHQVNVSIKFPFFSQNEPQSKPKRRQEKNTIIQRMMKLLTSLAIYFDGHFISDKTIRQHPNKSKDFRLLFYFFFFFNNQLKQHSKDNKNQ